MQSYAILRNPCKVANKQYIRDTIDTRYDRPKVQAKRRREKFRCDFFAHKRLTLLTTAMDDFPDFDEDDFTTTRPEMSTAREERIAAARAASASYSAKIEDPAVSIASNHIRPFER